MKSAKFIYTGWVCSNMSVSVENYDYTIYIERVEKGFECFSEGGSYGVKKTLGKAISLAEQNLKSIIKNNPE